MFSWLNWQRQTPSLSQVYLSPNSGSSGTSLHKISILSKIMYHNYYVSESILNHGPRFGMSAQLDMPLIVRGNSSHSFPSTLIFPPNKLRVPCFAVEYCFVGAAFQSDPIYTPPLGENTPNNLQASGSRTHLKSYLCAFHAISFVWTYPRTMHTCYFPPNDRDHKLCPKKGLLCAWETLVLWLCIQIGNFPQALPFVMMITLLL